MSLPSAIPGIPSGVIDINVYPNPADEYTVVSAGKATNILSVTITNSIGQQVYHKKDYAESEHIPLHSLKTGYYYLSVKTLNGTVYRQFSIVR